MKYVVTDINTVAEALRGEYEQKDGKYFLKVEGDIPQLIEANAKIAEFRDNNIGLNKKVTDFEAALKKFEGIDPSKYSELARKVAEFETRGGVKDASDIETRIREAVAPFERQLAEFQKRETEQKNQLARKDLEGRLRDVAGKAGVAESAVADFISRGLGVFNLEGRAMRGESPIFSKSKPAEPLSMEEWATGLMHEAPHLFKPSGGGGARPNQGGGTGGRRISGSDPLEFGYNLEDIAKGKVSVVPGS